MESLFVRYRNLVVLLAVLVAQIAGLAVQVRRNESGRSSIDETDTGGVRLFRYWAQAIVGPPQRLIHGTKLGVSSIWYGYFDLHRVRRENQDLQKTVDRLRLEQAELLEDAHQGQRLQAMLAFQQHYIYSTVPAQVFGSSGTDQSKLFYIDKGSEDGLKRDMPVISSDGIVGKLRDVFQHTAQVLMINDQTSGAGVILETTRTRGVLRGNAAGELEVVGLMADQRIKPGEKVLTAGGDLIFPRGLPVGTVRKVVADPERDSFIDVIVTPAAHIDQLDEVLVITATDPRLPAQGQKDISTSEALKGAEAEAVKEQMKASEIMAERLPGLNDPNAPAQPAPATAGQQPAANGQSPTPAANPAATPAPKLLPAAHPDRFSPGGGSAASSQPAVKPAQPSATGSANGAAPATAKPKQPAVKPEVQPDAQPAPQSEQPTEPGRTQ